MTKLLDLVPQPVRESLVGHAVLALAEIAFISRPRQRHYRREDENTEWHRARSAPNECESGARRSPASAPRIAKPSSAHASKKPKQEVPKHQPITALEVGVRSGLRRRRHSLKIRSGCRIRVEMPRGHGARSSRSLCALQAAGGGQRDEREGDKRQRDFANHENGLPTARSARIKRVPNIADFVVRVPETHSPLALNTTRSGLFSISRVSPI